MQILIQGSLVRPETLYSSKLPGDVKAADSQTSLTLSETPENIEWTSMQFDVEVSHKKAVFTSIFMRVDEPKTVSFIFFHTQYSTFWALMVGCWFASVYVVCLLMEDLKWLWYENRIYILGR